VDDTLISSTSSESIDEFGTVLQLKFNVTRDENVFQHLGIEMTKNYDSSITLRQSKLLTDILNEYPSDDKTPLYPLSSKPVTETNEQLKDSLKDRLPFLRLLGKLLYLTHTRPDISTAVSILATKSRDPTIKDFQSLMQIVAFLRQSADCGITLYPNTNESKELHLSAYVDASYMSHGDAASHTGYCIALGPLQPKSFFYSKSQKQKLIATSSTHAEIRALYELTIHIVFLLNMFNELGRPLEIPALIYEDNQPTIDLVKDNMGKINRSKHYLMLINFLREQVNHGLIKIQKVPTESNIANALTKIVAAPEFFTSFARIMGKDVKHNRQNEKDQRVF
jgi:hypothetical protein